MPSTEEGQAANATLFGAVARGGGSGVDVPPLLSAGSRHGNGPCPVCRSAGFHWLRLVRSSTTWHLCHDADDGGRKGGGACVLLMGAQPPLGKAAFLGRAERAQGRRLSPASRWKSYPRSVTPAMMDASVRTRFQRAKGGK